jgi:hypothetical protein
MWKWIKNLFTKNTEKDTDYSKMTKGDRKKLKAQGKIKSIYKPYN